MTALLLTLLPFAALLRFQSAAGPQEVEGRGTPAVSIPRIEQEIRIDGVLDEAPWQGAARLVGFHQYQPVDGRPAEERTEVLVWYAPRAIHFGIIAHARNPSALRATLADRDNIGNDDRVTIYLDTFHDQRRAFFFVVNPLGVQADGVRTEGAVSAGNIFGGSIDYNPDFFFESKGRVTERGYEVEVRIPFKSLRYPGTGGAPQRWGVNIVRNSPATGYEDTWTDTRRASASFLAQAGTLSGLRDLERGIVTEVQPFVTAASNGARDVASGRFVRDEVDPSAGANLRLGFTQLSLDATLNPDFSQVESDAGLVTVNERFALFIPEKRPFFLEGIELFSTPNQLVYTRRIADPAAGGKVTGKVGRYGVAHLTALDNTLGRDALFNITRLRRDLGGSSLAGLALTSREQGSAYNRVLAGDARIVFAKLYYFEGQLGGAWTRDALGTRRAPIWKAELDRTGRSWGFNYALNAIGQGFKSQAGFVPRENFVTGHVFNRLSWYGARGARLENFTTFFGPTRIWTYDRFGRDGAIEGNESVTGITRLRGGWVISTTFERAFFVFDDARYRDYRVHRGGRDPELYDAPDRLDGLVGGVVTVETPVYQRMNASVTLRHGAVPIFLEAAEGRETRASASVTLRPTPVVRIEATGVAARLARARDGSEFARTIIPRLKAEYQVTRALFFRLVGEYRSERHGALVDARTGAPLLIDGRRVDADERGGLQIDWLASFEPTPGTVAFVGYGSRHESPEADGFSRFRRGADGLFVKLAYQFRR